MGPAPGVPNPPVPIRIRRAVAYFFGNLQWTMTSSLAGLGAFFLLAALWREKDRKPPLIAYLLVFLLVILGVQIRYPSVGLIILVSLPTLWALIRDRTLTSARKTLVWFLAATALVSCLLIGYSHQFYQRDPGWVKFADFFDQHFGLHEARYPVYDAQSKPVFDSVGWTPNDLAMFQSWYFLNENVYSVEKLKKLNDYFPRFGIDKNPGYTLAQKLSFDTTQIALLFFFALLWLSPGVPSAPWASRHSGPFSFWPSWTPTRSSPKGFSCPPCTFWSSFAFFTPCPSGKTPRFPPRNQPFS